MPVVNHQLRLASRPVGLPDDQNWSFTEEEIDPTASPDAGTFLVKVLYLSLDPAMRGWMNEGRSYIPPVGIGEIMRALAVGEVVASANDAFPVGAYVSGVFGAQEYATSDGSGVTVVDPDLAALPTYLGVLGMTGMTAYFGLLEEAKPVEGDTVVVSGAAGAVGSVVGQIAKLEGCHVIGIAGGEEKCRMIIEEFGFDAAIDYKDADVAKALRDLAPKGVDIYFDNVGGDILDAVLTRLARGARVIICGAISQYNATESYKGPSNYMSLLVNRASMKGMVVFDYADRYADAAKEMAGWLAEGRLVAHEDVVEGGLAAFPATLLRLFRGENRGKLVLAL